MGKRTVSMQRRFTGAAAGLALCAAVAPTVSQAYPSKPIRTIVPYGPGGISDRLARQVGQKLSAAWSQQVIVENRPGGGTNIGSELVIRAPADGYTILWAGIANTVMPALAAKPGYDPMRDFAWITNIAKVPVLVVTHPSVPVRSARDLIMLAKAKPDALSFASSGTATSGHLAGELFKIETGARMIHIPYKGAAGALIDTLSGQVPLYFGAMASPISHVRAGKLRAIGLTTLRRSAAAPEIPTLHEQGVSGFDTSTWYGIAAPAGTPAAIVSRWQVEVAKAIQHADVRERLASEGAEFVGDTPEAFTQFVGDEVQKWARVVRSAGLRAD
jgi:tripartite-type tricarboxylate transporter receptor subunit TctC